MLKNIEKLFGSTARVRILRYLLSHRGESIGVEALAQAIKTSQTEVGKELGLLRKVEAVQDMVIEEYYDNGRSKSIKAITLNESFPYLDSLALLLLDFRFIDKKELAEGFKKYGKIKLLVLGGLFVTGGDRKLDILIVGDSLEKNNIEKFIKTIEADLGTELTFGIFETEEFRYRLEMYDRFIREFFKTSHEKVIEKISTRP